MATGTGKTYTAFNIIWRLWKSGQAKRVLFLADRNILVDQTIQSTTSSPFGEAMTKLTREPRRRGSGRVDTSYEIYLVALPGDHGRRGARSRSTTSSRRDFFDLIVIDECHRGSARRTRRGARCSTTSTPPSSSA